MDNSYLKAYENCSLCPRNCQVDRHRTVGFCGESAGLSIDAILLHHGEEPCISYRQGSGTIFFTGCSLRCPFCQNMQISQEVENRKIYSIDEFVFAMEKLIELGAENVNFVTPDHFSPHILEGIRRMKMKGYNLPFIYNCSGYQSIKNLKSVIDFVDIFLIDYKFADSELVKKIRFPPDYPRVCDEALSFIYKYKGNLKLDVQGKAIRGMLIRHLVMPGMVDNSLKIFNNLFVDYGNKIFFSLMGQYSPKYLKAGFEFLNQRVTKNEYKQVTNLVENLGFSNGYIQDLIDYDDEFLPDFTDLEIFK